MKATIQILSIMAIFMIGLGLSSTIAQTDTKTDNHNVGINIPEVALLDMESFVSKNLNFFLIAPTEAGKQITAPGNSTSIWLNYSSIVTASGADATRLVSVKANLTIPGIDIKVTAGADAGAGAGTKGTPVASAVTLTTADQTIISGIGSCWTDTGINKGHQLTYAVGLASAATYSSLFSGITSVTITYTLSDN
ncbi:hypothetical protein [Emticicia sp. SJ17W-69]|uniref:hypothetical protein n=1 Tax=Emticicia sp. SJ17W-69 TaxID=3421657 RepID=UPI003EBEB769